MASLALGFIGNALGGPIGGFIGATVGGLIDNMLFAGSQKVEGPRLTDLSVTASTYGAPIPLIYGPKNRLAGNVIWSTGLIETKHKEKSGGKGGGPSVTQVTYTYHVSLAIAFAEGPVDGVVKRIWANSKLIFNLDDATQAPDPPSADVAMVATQENGTHAVFNTLRVYVGNGTQQVDPTIEAQEGVGNAPAYRHTAYIVLDTLQLADFGNAIPNIEVEWEAHDEISVAAVVRDICRRAGIERISASQVSVPLAGYVASRPGPATAALEPLALAYDFDLAEQAGQVRVVRRGSSMRAVVPVGDMGGRESTSEPAEPIRYNRAPETTLPREAAVSFRDADLDYQVNTQRASRTEGSSDNNLSHEIAVTLTADEARELADRMLWEAWTARRAARLSLSDRWRGLKPADVFGVPVAGQIVPFKLARATRGASGVIEVEARYDDLEVYSSTAPGAAGTLPDNPLKLPGETRWQPMDTVLLQTADDNPGFYWAATGVLPGWRGAEILRSTDGGVTYQPMAPVAVGAVIGDVAAPLAAGPTEIWDLANTLTVTLAFAGDQLESVSDLLVYNGANAAWVGPANGRGGEIIQFRTATLVGPATYQLSGLLRGRLGTEHAVAGHGPDEVFVLLERGPIGRSDFGTADWNKVRQYKPVSVLHTEADTAAQSFRNTGASARPLSPVHGRGARDGNGDLTVTWIRRTRHQVPGLGGGNVPLGEADERYEVDVVAGSPPAVVRTIQATQPQAVYTAAQQAADGITPGDPVTVHIYQISDSRGRGHAGIFTV